MIGRRLFFTYLATHRRAESSTGRARLCRFGRWVLMVLFAAPLLTVFSSVQASAGKPEAGAGRATRPGHPTYHTIFALDVSGSVLRVLPQMKRFVADYTEQYILPGEEVTLLIFSYDSKGSVKEVITFTVPKGGSIAALTRALDDLAVQDSRKTRTYFRPLAEQINAFLAQVRLQPVVLVVSDGLSDGFDDFTQGKVDFREIPFESLGTRGIYQLPGVENWRIAVQGGSGLDLNELFSKPPATSKPGGKKKASIPPPPLGPVVDPCLIDPPLHVETSPGITFTPGFNPLEKNASASVNVTVRNECVARFRSFTVELSLGGGDFITVGNVQHTLIDQNPRAFPFTVTLPGDKIHGREAVLRVNLEQGNAVRSIYAEPAVLTLQMISYWSQYWRQWALGGSVLIVAVGLLLFLMVNRHKTRQTRGVVVKTLGGHAAARLAPYSHITLGGEGTAFPVPGVPPGLKLGIVEWMGSEKEVRLRGLNGFQLRLNGGDATDVSTYRLGQPVEFFNPGTGASFELALHRGRDTDIRFDTSTHGGDKDILGTWNSQDSNSFHLSSGNGGAGDPLI